MRLRGGRIALVCCCLAAVVFAGAGAADEPPIQPATPPAVPTPEVAAQPAAADAAGDSPPRDYADELPRIAPLEPAEALASFVLRPGFRLELVAAEPLVCDPVALSFDADGRLYVVEMRGYSEQPDEALGRVKLLVDRDGDGAYETATVFLDGLSWPTAIICYDGGVFVGDAPDLIYAKDRDGDGVAEHREVVLTGFGKTNVQGLLNSLAWGLDNRIHGATSSSGGQVRRPDAPEAEAVSLSGRDFAFDPKTMVLEATGGGGQHGLTFDDWGAKFVCHNSDHFQQVMCEDRYLARNPYLAVAAARASIAPDGPQAEVFRQSPVEPWRIVRTRLRVEGLVPGVVEGGGRPAGYFTSATGITVYRGDAWPDELRGQAFVGDVGSNIVHRKRIEYGRLPYVARRIDEGVEFLASRDVWFRPCQFANAPDGTLWVLDMYREVIEHPDSLPPIIKQHLDLTSGRDRGRIYRIAAAGSAARGPVRLSRLSTPELVALLEHANGWHRDTAARLLYQRQDPAAVAPLVRLAGESRSPRGKVHALWALAGQRALAPELLLAALADEHPRVRQCAVRLAERLPEAESGEVFRRLYTLVTDPDREVRYQLAFTLGEARGQERFAALAELARREAGNSWMRLAIQSSLNKGAGGVLAALIADGEFRAGAGGRALLIALAGQIARQQQPADVQALRRALDAQADAAGPLVGEILLALSQSASGRALVAEWTASEGSRLARLLERLLDQARTTAGDAAQPLPKRTAAVSALALDRPQRACDALAALLAAREEVDIQLAALAALDRLEAPEVAPRVLAAWPGFSPALRRRAAELLLARPERVAALIEALESGRLAPGELEPARLAQLRAHPDEALRRRGEALLASAALARRTSVVEAYRPALELAGDVERGRALFRKHCAACHQTEGLGHAIGPNLATVQNRGPEAILLNLLDPNREVNPQYLNYTLVTSDGRTITGMLTAESAASVTLTRAEGASDTVLRVEIDELQSTALSLMPEGLEKDLDLAAVADLIAYLGSLK